MIVLPPKSGTAYLYESFPKNKKRKRSHNAVYVTLTYNGKKILHEPLQNFNMFPNAKMLKQSKRIKRNNK